MEHSRDWKERWTIHLREAMSKIIQNVVPAHGCSWDQNFTSPLSGRGIPDTPRRRGFTPGHISWDHSSRKNSNPWKLTPGWIGKSSEPNPPLLSSMLIFQDVFSTQHQAWVDSIEANSKVNEAIFSICLPVLLVSVLLLRNPGSHRSQKNKQKSYHQSKCRNK